MPQMGESITEGTITRWRLAVGEAVERDDPLFDISTDKVDTEVPAALDGRLVEILVAEGKTVEVNTVVARIAAEGEAWSPGSAAPDPPEEREDSEANEIGNAKTPSGGASTPSRRRPRSSPLVRRMAREHGVDLAEVPGTGEGGRVSKQDMLDWLEQQERPAASAQTPAAAETPARADPTPLPTDPLPADPLPVGSPAGPPDPTPEVFPASRVEPAPGYRTEPLSQMRRTIAEHMVRSRRTSAHVTTVFEVDLSRVTAIRSQEAAAFEARAGVRLTLMPFFTRAAIEALAEFPILNASLSGDEIVHHRAVGLGIAVALPDGLIVPVLERADERNFVGLARGITDLAARARSGSLTPAEVQGGTFTITNPGPFGALFGTPIIAQPQVAILGVGGVHKRAVVVEGDAIAVRSMVFLALSFDHRLIDGAVADQFMASVKSRLEHWPEGGGWMPA